MLAMVDDEKRLKRARRMNALRVKRYRRRQGIKAKGKVGQVYFIACGEFVKIGWTTDIAQRLATLQQATPLELSLLATFEAWKHHESATHRRFGHLRIRGEWFTLSDEIRAALACGTAPWIETKPPARPRGRPRKGASDAAVAAV